MCKYSVHYSTDSSYSFIDCLGRQFLNLLWRIFAIKSVRLQKISIILLIRFETFWWKNDDKDPTQFPASCSSVLTEHITILSGQWKRKSTLIPIDEGRRCALPGSIPRRSFKARPLPINSRQRNEILQEGRDSMNGARDSRCSRRQQDHRDTVH